MRKRDYCDAEKFCTLDSGEKMIAILGDGWWPQHAKREGNKTSTQGFIVICGKQKRKGCSNVGGDSVGSRNDAPSCKECVVKVVK